MPVFTDQCGGTISLTHVPCRIISLVPSQTELLAGLGLDNEVKGITKFCVHPGHWFQSKTKIGGTKKLNMEAIHRLQPDLVIANREENDKAQVEELRRNYPVWTSDVRTLNDALQMILSIGMLTGTSQKATMLTSQIEGAFRTIQNKETRKATAYFIWQKPYMAAGGDTFIHDMMTRCGFENIFADVARYPETTPDEIREKKCSLILLSSEPFPFREKQAKELRDLLPGTKIVLADGEMFSWYGSRLLYAPAYFTRLLKQIGQ